MTLGHIHQTREGSFMIGRSAENVGLADRNTTTTMHSMAATALRILPYLSGVQVVRAWAGLRVMAPDAYPLYDQSEAFPGAFSVTCHSAVTLAAVHALVLAPAILEGHVPPELASFTGKRFGERVSEDAWVSSRTP